MPPVRGGHSGAFAVSAERHGNLPFGNRRLRALGGGPDRTAPAADSTHAAWHAIGDILFWLHKDATRHRDAITALWRRIDGQILLAAGDVLHQLASSQWRSSREHERGIDLIAHFPQEVRRVAEACLDHLESLPSVFRSNNFIDARLILFLIGVLGRCGDGGSLAILKVYAEVEKFGRAAVEAIQSIQQRLLQGSGFGAAT